MRQGNCCPRASETRPAQTISLSVRSSPGVVVVGALEVVEVGGVVSMEHIVTEELVVVIEMVEVAVGELRTPAVGTVEITMEVVEVLDLGLLLSEVSEVEAMTMGEGVVSHIVVGSNTVEAVVETVTVDTVVEAGVTVSVSETVMGEHVVKD